MRLFGEFPKKVASSRAESRTDSEPTRCAVRVLEPQQSTGMIVVNVERGTVGGVEQLTADASELHAKLGSGAHFRDWIKDRVSQLKLFKNQYFCNFAEISAKPGRPPVAIR